MQEIYVYMDDSGKLTKNDTCVFYGGVVFLNTQDKDVFERKYKKIRNRLSCKNCYCKQLKNSCNRSCPELKSYILKNKDRRQFMSLIVKELTYFVIVEVKEINKIDFSKSVEVGRYQEYAQKIAIKKICETLITCKKINLDEEIKIVVYIDQDSHISNARYSFSKNLKLELLNGWDKQSKYNYSYYHIDAPFEKATKQVIIECKENVESHKVIGVQASDILVGTYRRYRIHDAQRFLTECPKVTMTHKLP